MNTKYILIAIAVGSFFFAVGTQAQTVTSVLINKSNWTLVDKSDRQVEVFKIKDGKNTCYVTLNAIGSSISCVN